MTLWHFREIQGCEKDIISTVFCSAIHESGLTDSNGSPEWQGHSLLVLGMEQKNFILKTNCLSTHHLSQAFQQL
jgi:hypothetical protein